jgi:murein DD-endopeptidase MepM/ murein hydrolase activator NlpD
VRPSSAVLRAAVACIAALATLAGGPARADIVSKIKQKQQEIHSVHVKLNEKRSELDRARTRQLDLQNQLAATNQSIKRVSSSLEGVRAEIAGNERRSALNERRLAAARATLELHSSALKRRLVDAYEHGELSYLNVLFSATSFTDFVQRWDDIRLLVTQNQQAVRERRAAEAKVAAIQAQLEDDHQRLLAAQAVEEQKRSQLAALAAQRTMLVAQADLERRHVAQEVSQLEEISASEEAELGAMIVQRQREEAARREAARRARQLAGETLPPETGPGLFSWPASGPITSPFGVRTDPMTGQARRHNGIDIGAPMGATISAAASGTVIYAGWESGYGNTIVIDHDGAVSTLYGHCSQIFVSNGQEVQRGQAIGAVGSTGRSTGPHLHFEVRVNGVAVDPTGRLR